MPAASLERPRPPVAVLVAVALGVLVVAVVLGLARSEPEPAPAGPAPTPTPQPSRTTAPPQVDTTEEATYAERRAVDPDRLEIPDLGVDAPVLPVAAPGRELVPPRDPQRLGWWAEGARPGAEQGSALVVGHTVNGGGGALDDLETLRPGAAVTVRADRGDVAYEVSSVRVYDKGRIARDAERLFSQQVPGRLVVLTCEDWDGSRYLSNVVVVAKPVAGPA